MLTQLPAPVRTIAVRHRELLKFAFVGASTFVIDTSLFYVLKWTVLAPKPVTAKVVAVLVATIVSYVLNREWAFRTRGGRERHHEASLYFLFSGIAVALYAAPLWISRYALHLQTPYTSRFVEEIADFTSGQILGVLLGMAFRWWAFRKWVFPAGRGTSRSSGRTEAPWEGADRPVAEHPSREPTRGSAGTGVPTTGAENLH
ncbi:GtrA family protein [Actinopolyspora halophila]|uniref:GtrA family protein n=1 Tax=Actinopolyspora halophila TaxID=1850 RepID=UPI0003693459